MSIVWLALVFASAGVFHHSGIKIPFFAFFGHDAGHRVKEAPASMLIAMGIAAFFCIFLGVYPKFLYSILPYPVDFLPYTASHVLFQLQLLMFSALAFTLLLLSGIYPAEIRAINIDTDWFYRKGGRLFYQVMDKGLNAVNRTAERVFIGEFLISLTRFVRELPAKLLVQICRPFWQMDTASGDKKAASEKLLKRAQSGFYPIGIIGLFTALYFGLLFIL